MKILVAGVGNIFLGDDAFGVEVAQRLTTRDLPEGVHVVDFGIRGLDLTYALLDPYDAVILVDALPRGEAPGTLYVLEPTAEDASGSADGCLVQMHDMDPAKVLHLARAMGSRVDRLLVVGCEPTPLADADDMQMGLSQPVLLGVDEAVRLVEGLIDRLRSESPIPQKEVRT